MPKSRVNPESGLAYGLPFLLSLRYSNTGCSPMTAAGVDVGDLEVGVVVGDDVGKERTATTVRSVVAETVL